MRREQEPCRKIKGQGHSPHLNFVHRPVKPVYVRPITLLCTVGYNLAQMVIMIRRCVANKNHVTRLKVIVTVRSLTLCIAFNETCSCPANNFVMRGGILENKLAQMIIMIRWCVANKNHVAGLKLKVTVRSKTLRIGFNKACSCQTHIFVMHGGIWK